MNSRRLFLKTTVALPLTAAGVKGAATVAAGQNRIYRIGGPKIKISLNAYSFNRPLRDGVMTLDDLLEFCAEVGFAAVDLTAYYFPGYPTPPTDTYLYQIKRKAYLLGIDISGTGVRTDFTAFTESKRAADIQVVRQWAIVASKLGAPALRIFAGRDVPAGESREPRTRWVAECIRECASIGKEHGVMMVLQNHHEFIKTPDQLMEILNLVHSDWLAVHLDIGSFRSGDPFAEIAAAAPFAATWQIKEHVYIAGQPTKTDLRKIVGILRDVDFRGYVLLETLGEGDPWEKVPQFFKELEAALDYS